MDKCLFVHVCLRVPHFCFFQSWGIVIDVQDTDFHCPCPRLPPWVSVQISSLDNQPVEVESLWEETHHLLLMNEK